MKLLPNGDYREVMKRRVPFDLEELHIKEKSYIIDENAKLPWWTSRLEPMIPMDIDKGTPLFINYGKFVAKDKRTVPDPDAIKMELTKNWSAATYNRVFKRNLIMQIIAGSTKSLQNVTWRQMIMPLIMGVMIGLFIGIIAGPYLIPHLTSSTTATGTVSHG